VIQLHRLEGFYWVAREGGYAAAARAFPYPITQPAVHQQVKKLEAELGLALFERTGRDHIVPTAAGRRLYDFVAPFFAGIDGVVREVRAGEYGGELRIYAAPTFLRRLLPAWVRRLRAKRPDVRIDLRELDGTDPAPLLDGEADLLVGPLLELPPGVGKRRVATIHPCLVLPSGHKLAARKRVGLKDLASETFVGYTPGTILYDLQMQELARHRVRPQHVLTTDSTDTILGYVESGLGFSLIPWLDPAGPRNAGIASRPYAARRHVHPVYAVWRTASSENPLVQVALACAPEDAG